MKPLKGTLDFSAEKDVPHEHEIKEAADTLTRAEEIKADHKLMPHVSKHLASKHKHVGLTIKSISDLKVARQNLPDDESKEDPKEEKSETKKQEKAEQKLESVVK